MRVFATYGLGIIIILASLVIGITLFPRPIVFLGAQACNPEIIHFGIESIDALEEERDFLQVLMLRTLEEDCVVGVKALGDAIKKASPALGKELVGLTTELTILQGNELRIKEFIEVFGFQMDTDFGDGKSLLLMAVTGEQLELAKWMLEQGADPRQFSPRSPLMAAAMQADETWMELFADWLLAKDVTLSSENCLGVFFLGLHPRSDPLVGKLLRVGMGLDCLDSEGKSALALAVEMQSAGVVKRLLDARPTLKTVDYDAIMAAGKRRGDVEVLSAIEEAMGNKQLPQR
jgi:hypothetical protein